MVNATHSKPSNVAVFSRCGEPGMAEVYTIGRKVTWYSKKLKQTAVGKIIKVVVTENSIKMQVRGFYGAALWPAKVWFTLSANTYETLKVITNEVV
jgi:hypothetical protein